MPFFLFMHSSFESFSPSFDRRMILRYYSEKKSQEHLTSNFDQTYRMSLDIYYLYLTVPYIVVDGTVTIQSSAFHQCYIATLLHSTCSWQWWCDYMFIPPPAPKKRQKGMFQTKEPTSSNVFKTSRTWRYNAKIQQFKVTARNLWMGITNVLLSPNEIASKTIGRIET